METGYIGDPKAHQLERLAIEHRTLKARVHELASHLRLTSSEQLELAELKKRKLHAKDQLYMLRLS